MKTLILLLLSFKAHAVILSQYVSTPDAVSEQRFELTKNSAQYVKRSNYFDQKKNQEIGTYSLSVSRDEFAVLEETLSKVKTVDELLKKKNLSFNDLSDKDPHAPFFFLDEYRITKSSDLYPELKTLFAKLQGKALTSFTGVRVSEDLKILTTFEKGQEKKKETFALSFHCKDEQAPTVCLFKDYGTLFLSTK